MKSEGATTKKKGKKRKRDDPIVNMIDLEEADDHHMRSGLAED
jgi:hypothetical protein